MNPKVVQAIMGHQHYSTTIDIYTHVTETKDCVNLPSEIIRQIPPKTFR